VPLEIENKINLDNTTDADLVELAGLHGYLKPDVESSIKVSEKSFEIVDNFSKGKRLLVYCL
jgi:hypothetical protein